VVASKAMLFVRENVVLIEVPEDMAAHNVLSYFEANACEEYLSVVLRELPVTLLKNW
jgi:exo-beta-1,3-glucanase (GH17 family)